MFSIAEVAQAAGVPQRRVLELVQTTQVVCRQRLVSEADAVRLVRALTGLAQGVLEDRPAITTPFARRRRSALSLLGSGLLHAAFLALLALITSLGWLAARDTDQPLKDKDDVHLVFLMEPGPGGGGGGGGTQVPVPPLTGRAQSAGQNCGSQPGPAGSQGRSATAADHRAAATAGDPAARGAAANRSTAAGSGTRRS